jgi:DNA-binding winged helix-turn-helix (wHTH) protein
VSLTPRNFDLLVFLVEHSGRLVSKDQIFEAVWHGSFVEEANLTVSIANLRKTLGERPGGLPYIETVPKKGYRFAAPVREVSSLEDGVAQPTLDLDKDVITPAESLQSNGHSPRAVVALVQPTLETGNPKSAGPVPSVAVAKSRA